VQGSEWLVPQIALLHTWAGEDQCKVIIITIITIIIIFFMQGIYTYIPETNCVPREYNVAAVLLLLFMVLIMLLF